MNDTDGRDAQAPGTPAAPAPGSPAPMLELTAIERPGGAADLVVTLTWEQRQRSRLRVALDNGRDAGIVLAAGLRVADGDVLLAPGGERVRVVAAAEPVTTAHSDDPVLLARACYHLGNRHVPVQVFAGAVRYRDDHVLDGMVRGLGLRLSRERAPFSPESGAYSAAGHGHAPAAGDGARGHGHPHAHDHQAHDHTHDHLHDLRPPHRPAHELSRDRGHVPARSTAPDTAAQLPSREPAAPEPRPEAARADGQAQR